MWYGRPGLRNLWSTWQLTYTVFLCCLDFFMLFCCPANYFMIPNALPLILSSEHNLFHLSFLTFLINRVKILTSSNPPSSFQSLSSSHHGVKRPTWLSIPQLCHLSCPPHMEVAAAETLMVFYQNILRIQDLVIIQCQPPLPDRWGPGTRHLHLVSSVLIQAGHGIPSDTSQWLSSYLWLRPHTQESTTGLPLSL
jgi:hypothetical protein